MKFVSRSGRLPLRTNRTHHHHGPDHRSGPRWRATAGRAAAPVFITTTGLLLAAVWMATEASAHAEGQSPVGGGATAAHPSDRDGESSGDSGASASVAGRSDGRALPRDSGEPSVDALCKAAVTLALAEPERAQSFISRARLAGWLPEVHFRAYRRFARTEGLTFADMGTGTVAPVDISAVDDVRYEWRASWDLSRMVFNPDELQAHFEGLRMADVRRDIQSLVIKLYFERRRLIWGVDAPAAAAGGAAAMERRSLRVAEIEAQLDAVSGGAFSAGSPAGRQAVATP